MSNLEHGAAYASEFLEHFGVRGMKWGFRKGSSGKKGPPSHHAESDDARNAKLLSAKVKGGGTKSLSNKELKTLVERMNLEQSYARISTPAARKQNPILAGAAWTARRAATITGQSMETVIKANLANEMNTRLKAQIGSPKKAEAKS